MSKIQAVRNVCNNYNMNSNVKRIGADIYQNQNGDKIERMSDKNCRYHWYKITLSEGRTFDTPKIW